jgi:prepilin-type N-terminal cleavage/methylation domain-containing protein
MQKSKNAFTMIEMVFVIVILGILAAVAIPRLAATRTDAEITKGRSDIASIRSAIVSERQTWLIRGISTYIKTGTSTETVNGATRKEMDNGGLFGGVLMYPIAAGDWARGASDVNSTTYTYTVNNTATTFTYTRSSGRFTCVASSSNDCSILVD